MHYDGVLGSPPGHHVHRKTEKMARNGRKRKIANNNKYGAARKPEAQSANAEKVNLPHSRADKPTPASPELHHLRRLIGRRYRRMTRVIFLDPFRRLRQSRIAYYLPEGRLRSSDRRLRSGDLDRSAGPRRPLDRPPEAWNRRAERLAAAESRRRRVHLLPSLVH
jgi:hypothetical protein